jgi:hypothetical protein
MWAVGMWYLFEAFVWGHIATGTVGLVSFWVPIVGDKGSANHRFWGRVFSIALIATGFFATGMSICTIIAPVETHPKITDLNMITGLFGWMMLYLATLTVALTWYGWSTAVNRRQHEKNRHWINVSLQVLMMVTGTLCAWQGVITTQPLMIGIATIGYAAGLTNLYFIFSPQPSRLAYQSQHAKAIVGAGSSVYTAFLSFGAARLMPSQAFNPLLWALPIGLGVAYIIYHQRRLALIDKAITPPRPDAIRVR